MKTKINLIPRELQKRERKFPSLPQADSKLILKLIIPLIILKLFMGISNTRMRAEINKIQEKINSYTERTSALESSAQTDLKVKKEKIDKIKSMIKLKEKELKDFGSIAEISADKEKFVYALLKLLAKSISDEMWLKEVSFDKEKNDFSLEGFSYSHPKIGTFLAKLGKSAHLRNLYMKHSQTFHDEENGQDMIRFEAEGKFRLGLEKERKGSDSKQP